METINWFFNSDFEERLARNKLNEFNSTPLTQEFEYFINYLEPQSTIYTTKDYSKDFKDRFEKFTGHKFLHTSSRKNLKNWCQEYREVELLKKIQSKEFLLRCKNQDLIEHEVELIDSERNLKEDFLYKRLYSVGGMGHYEMPQHQNKLKKLLKKESLIKEEKLNRQFDFSSLFENQTLLAVYQNYVDDFYQYKSTILGPIEFHYNHHLVAKSYDFVLREIQNYQGVFSIDSFVYLKEGKEYTQPISEVNMRKTMGYFAFKFKEKYFKNFSWAQLVFYPQRKLKQNWQEIENIFLLSPFENKFYVFYIVANDKKELQKKYDLIATLFESL